MSQTPVSEYLMFVREATPRLLSMLDREPASPTAGSFDRDHWAWKFRDFPLTMLQAGMLPLAQLWAHPFHDNPLYQSDRVREWTELAIRETCRRQRRNGGFESVAPNAYDHGVTLAVVHLLARTVGLFGPALTPGLIDRVRETIRRACDFAAVTDEDYAFISNHQALFALAWLHAEQVLGDSRLGQRADAVITAILQRQSGDGWFAEYGGADPGYETLGIWYLSQVWELSREQRLLEALRRSITFLSWMAHPDSSLGGAYGSRATSLYYPGGFEALAGEIPEAASLARFLLPALRAGAVVTPSASDAENLALLVSSYIDAAARAGGEHVVSASRVEPLPCDSWCGVRCFPDSGLVVAGFPLYFATASAARGGMLRVSRRGPAATLAYEDAGLVAEIGGRSYSSQAGGRGRLTTGTEGHVVCDAPLTAAVRVTLTPMKFVLLRLMNLTVFRNRGVGEWIRRRIVRQLVTSAVDSGIALRRTLRFTRDRIAVSDELSGDTGRIDRLSAPRAFTPMHMGSARYFTRSELAVTPTPSVPSAPRWTSRFAIAFAADGSPQLLPEHEASDP